MAHQRARIDRALARKLAHLRRRTGQSVTEIVRDALDLYYEAMRRGEGSPRPPDASLVGLRSSSP